MMHVSNMVNNNGNTVPNQFEITNNGRTYFQSYKSIIACKNFSGKIELDSYYWNYSRTTSKYRNIFLGETTKETQKKINSGEYLLTDLNGGN
jgi:hypothetical protein